LANRKPGRATHNAALEVVARTAEENLLLDNLLLGRHLSGPFAAIETGGDEDKSAGKHGVLGKSSRASCGGAKEG